MIPPDVVYITRPGEFNDELRYSLRTLEENVPHARVWVVGYLPRWLKGVEFVQGNLAGDKWRNVPDNLRLACEAIDADRLLIMNDDFFVTGPVRSIPFLHRGPLAEHLARVKPGPWRKSLRQTKKALEERGIEDPLSYELHVPVVMDRSLLLETARDTLAWTTDIPPQWRTMYGNAHRPPSRPAKDGKSRHLTEGLFLSSDDSWWRDGAAGTWVRSQFTRPSRYEVPLAYDAHVMSNEQATFRNTKYPALRILMEGRSYKLAGGRYTASGKDADALRHYALANPKSGLREVDSAGEDVDMAARLMDGARRDTGPVEASQRMDESDEPPMGYRELQAAVKALGKSARGSRADLEARLEGS